jgi:hypothetical protein
MPLHLTDGWNDRGAVGDWRLPGEPAFAESRALELLVRDLRRYVAEEISGRSVLVAGHRGAGKTATVTQAWRILRNDILRASADEPVLGRRGRLQRPLLVKLVGESLIAPAPDLKPSGADEPAKPPAQGDGAADAKPKPAGGPAAPAPPGAKAAADKPKPRGDPVESALAHITIALYRALAAEIAEGFAVHALGPARDRRDRMELAAQLALELDGTPDPAALRNYWDRLGRLADGVLWPPEADEKLRPLGLGGQGYREVIAVATAAQAFQVCSGAVTYSETNHDSATRESTLTTTVDIKDLIGKVGALGAGALAGGLVGASNGALPGVGTGLLVGLLSGVALNWSGSRNRKSDRKLDYTFLRDRSIQTLDRDLPLVIARVREAGLAPVFVIDELDKLEDPAGTITSLIKRLKHLVSDYGFFCFLTDRNYFDAIETKVSEEAYPPEHTYFGERVLILNRPQDLFAYVYGLIGSPDADYELRAAVLALAVMFRSKLNFADLNRQINQLIHPDNSVTLSDLDLTGSGRLRLEATIQLAINEVLSSEDIAERFRTDLGFAQLAIDALYHIVRCWQKDAADQIDLSYEALGAALLKRRLPYKEDADKTEGAPGHGGEPSPDGDDPGKAEEADAAAARKDPAPIGKSDLGELTELVNRVAGYLQDFGSLKAALAARTVETAAQGPVERRLLSDVVINIKGMMEPVGRPVEARYRFVIDELARVRPRDDEADPGAKAGARQEQQEQQQQEHQEEQQQEHQEQREAPAVEPEHKPKRSAGRRPARGKPEPPAPSPPSPEVMAEATAVAEPPAAAEPPSAEAPAEESALPLSSPLLDAISKLVTSTKVSLSDLVASRLLPATVGSRSFEATLSDYRLAQQDPQQIEARRRAEGGETALRQAFDSHGANLARAFVVLNDSIYAAGATEPPSSILQRIGRYLGPDSIIDLPAVLATVTQSNRIDGSPESIRAFAETYERWNQARKAPRERLLFPEPGRASEWENWREKILDFLRRGSALFSTQTSYHSLQLAASNQTPGTLFRPSLIDMDQLDWSRAALAALPTDDGEVEAPHWLLFAALAALGFDAGDLDRLSRILPLPRKAEVDPADPSYIAEIVSRATTRPRGALHVYRDGVGAVPPREIPEFKPMLSVGESVGMRYTASLSWLVENQLFDEGRDEID